MSFFAELQRETENERAELLSTPIIRRCLQEDIELADYVAFLTQAYHHVKHTVPLLMAVGSRLPEEKEWLREAVAEYINEELGHQEWILNDIAACGFDKEKARRSIPNFETELLVSYAYDMANRVNPLGFFGMVHVLEGTSIQVADAAADAIQNKLGLPRTAFTYLRSHGALDQEHVKFFQQLMGKISCEREQQMIIRCARNFYRLYAGVFKSIEPEQALELVA